MPKKTLAELAATVGASQVAARVLALPKLDVEGEAFLQACRKDLSAEELSAWLTKEDPGDPPTRPNAQIVAALAERVDDLAWHLEVTGLLDVVKDAEVKHDLLERVYRAGPLGEALLRKYAKGGSVFDAVARLEREDPSDWSRSLLLQLFADRRDDAACAAKIRAAAAAPATRIHALRVMASTEGWRYEGPLKELVGDIPLLLEMEDLQALEPTRELLAFVATWPDQKEREAYLFDRLQTAASRGVAWGCLWWECPPEMRDRLALASIGTARPAPWSLPAVVRNRTGRDAWRLAVSLLDRHADADELNALLVSDDHLFAALGRRPTPSERSEAMENFHSSGVGGRAWLAALPPPDDADAAWEEEFAEVFGSSLGDSWVRAQLRLLPLTAERARRVLARTPSTYFWLEPQIEETIAAALPYRLDVPPPRDPAHLEAYRRLVGPRADELIADAVSASLDLEDLPLFEVLPVADLLGERLPQDLLDRLRAIARKWPVSAKGTYGETYPWLVTADEMRAAVTRESPSWGNLDLVPARYLDDLERDAGATPNPARACALLDHLEKKAFRTRREVLTIAHQRLMEQGPDAVSPAWLASKLDTKSLWKDPGESVLWALLERRATAGVHAVAAILWDIPFGRALDLGPAIHAALGRCLVADADLALGDGQPARAMRALRALASLTPGSAIRGRLLALKKHSSGASCADLIDANAELMRRGRDDASATFAALRDALAIMEREVES